MGHCPAASVVHEPDVLFEPRTEKRTVTPWIPAPFEVAVAASVGLLRSGPTGPNLLRRHSPVPTLLALEVLVQRIGVDSDSRCRQAPGPECGGGLLRYGHRHR